MGCFTHCRKWTVLSFNLIFLLIGVTLIIVGAIFTHNLNDFRKATPESYHYLTATPIILLVLGSIIVLVSIFGSLGVFKKNLFLLNTYTIILLVIFVLQIILSIVTFWAVSNQSTLAVKVNSTVDDIFKDYTKNKDTVDFLQKKLECCGTDGPKFWGANIPSSCYSNEEKKIRYESGCQNALYDSLLNSVRIIGTTILALSPIQVIGATLSLSLVNAIRNYYRRYGKYGA